MFIDLARWVLARYRVTANIKKLPNMDWAKAP